MLSSVPFSESVDGALQFGGQFEVPAILQLGVSVRQLRSPTRRAISLRWPS